MHIEVPGVGYVVELGVSLNEKAYIEVVSKGLKQDEALTVIGTIKKGVDVVLRHLVGLAILG